MYFTYGELPNILLVRRYIKDLKIRYEDKLSKPENIYPMELFMMSLTCLIYKNMRQTFDNVNKV